MDQESEGTRRKHAARPIVRVIGESRLALAGDVMLGRLVDRALASAGPDAPWRQVAPFLADVDAFIFNLESAVCGPLPEWKPDEKAFHFRLDPAHIATLRSARVDAVLLANNHVMDYGVEGLIATLDALDAAGVAHAGAGRSLDEARAPATVRGRLTGRRLALIGAADHPSEWAAGERSPGIFVMTEHDARSVEDVAKAIHHAREEGGAQTVVLGLHWGPNMRRVPPQDFRWFAHKAIDSGADIVWGTSAHLFQGIEFYQGHPILYDTGDFLDDYMVDPYERNDLSFLFTVELDAEGRSTHVGLQPTVVRARRVAGPTRVEERFAVAKMRECCAAFGTCIEPEAEHGYVARPADRNDAIAIAQW